MNAKEIQAQIDEDGGELAPLDALVPWDRNPRINDIAAKQLAAFVADKGWGAPILVQRGTNRIIGGHTRWKAAKKLGLKRVPVRYRTCDDRTADALAMADNKLGEVAEWNAPGVAEVLSGFGLEEAEAMGWDSHDLEQLAKDVADFGPLEPAAIVEDEVPEPPKVAVTKLGDVWRMGRHTLVCGDARAFAFGDVALVVTDPPYGLGGYSGRSGKRKPVEGDDADVGPLLAAIPAAQHRYVWCEWRTYPRFLELLGEPRSLVVWGKPWPGMGRGYRRKHEFCLFYGELDSTEETDLWWDGYREEGIRSTWERTAKHNQHPTQKPVEVMARPMRNHPGAGAVADPFLGSGTTLVAAEQCERICVGTEIDPAYCDVIVERWQALTGGKAERTSG